MGMHPLAIPQPGSHIEHFRGMHSSYTVRLMATDVDYAEAAFGAPRSHATTPALPLQMPQPQHCWRCAQRTLRGGTPPPGRCRPPVTHLP
jgi:hypothetical protein